jgi:peptidyl-prolyl cis-trans isomerase C
MKRLGKMIVVCLFSLLGALYTIAAPSDPTTVLVTINGENIVRGDLDFLMDVFVLPQYRAQNQGQELSTEQRKPIEQSIIEQMITERLILQYAAQAQITADEGILLQQFAAAKEKRSDIPPEQLKQFLWEKLTIQTVIQKTVTSKLTITDQELQDVYNGRKEQFNEPEKVRASHILIKVDPNASGEEKNAARQKIENILAKAKAGDDFAQLAQQHSECPTNQKGGDLGFFPRGIMVAPFEEVAFTLEQDTISDIIETQFGYHIIKVTDKKSQRKVPFEEAEENLRQELLQQKSSNEVNKWISTLRTNANIQHVNPL